MAEAPATLPPGEYAIVECMGHRTMVGRIGEIERFGTKLLHIEPIFDGAMLPGVMVGGQSIYQLTPCSPEVALRKAPTRRYELPPSIAHTLPPAALTDSSDGEGEDDDCFAPDFMEDDDCFAPDFMEADDD